MRKYPPDVNVSETSIDANLGAAQARLSLHLSNYQIVGNQMSMLKRCSLFSLIELLESIDRHQRKVDLLFVLMIYKLNFSPSVK